MYENPPLGDEGFEVNSSAMEHSFGIEPSEVKAVKDLFQYDNPPEITVESDLGKVFVWLETLAEKKHYSISEMKQTAEEPGDNAEWILMLSVPDKEGLLNYFKLLDEYRTINPNDIDLVTSKVFIEIGSGESDVKFTTDGEIIVEDGKLIIPNDTMNHAIQPKSKSKTEGDSSVRLKEKVNILEGYRKIYEVFYKRLTEEGISLDDEGIKVYSELDIKHRVNDNSVDTLLSKRLSIHFEQAIEGETPEDLRYLRLNVNIDIKKPELLNLKQLKIGMKSEDVKNVLNGYIPLPKN